MASKSRIQGITIELDGDSRNLNKALQDVNKRTISLQSELRDVERLLKFDPDNVELLAQKQKLLTQQIENTNEKLTRLRSVYSQVEKQAKSGEIGEEQFRAFQREIAQTEQQLKGFQTRLDKMDSTQVNEAKKSFDKLSDSINQAESNAGGLVDSLGGLAAGAGSVMGIGEIIEKSLDVSSLNTQIDIGFNIPEESKATVKEATRTVEAFGVDSEEALEGIRRQWALNSEATDEANEMAVKYAGTITRAYGGLDFTEVVQESSELSKILGINNDEALALMNILLETGFDPGQIDTIAEYGSQLQRMGYNAEEVMGLFAAGIETGTNNIAQLIDGVKEGRILMAEFGATIDEETGTLLTNVGISTEQFQAWGKAIAEGGEGGKKAYEEVASAIAGIEDKTLQNQLGVKTFGSLWEEQGTRITDTILGVGDNMLDMGGMIDVLNDKTNSLETDPYVKLKNAMGDLVTALEPIMTGVAEFIGKIAEWVSENPKLAATIGAIGTALGIILGLFAAIMPVVVTLTSLFPVMGTVIAALSGPIGWIVGAIAGLIAVGIALWTNWDTLKAKLSEIWESIKNFAIQTWENIKSFFTTTIPEIINNISNWFNELPGKLGYALGYALATIVKWGVDTLNYIKTNVPIWIDNIINFFKQLPGNIASWLSQTIAKVIAFGSELSAKARETGSNFINNIINSVKNLPSRMYEIGSNIVQGVWNGISGMWGWFTNKVTSFFDGIVSGVKDVLGIHSPSRVFAEIGQFTGEGFVQGIDGMKKAVSQAGQSMANAAIPTINTPNISGINSGEQIVYLTNETYLDGRLIGTETTKQVINNMNRQTRNYKMAKGGLGYV